MTKLKDDIADDIDKVFLDKDEHAIEAIYFENGAGNGRPVIGILENVFVEIAAGDPGVEGTRPTFTAQPSDVPNIAHEDTIKFRAADVFQPTDTTYKVRGIQPNSPGDMKTLVLERQ